MLLGGAVHHHKNLVVKLYVLFQELIELFESYILENIATTGVDVGGCRLIKKKSHPEGVF